MSGAAEVVLAARPPFALDPIVAHLAARAVPGVEEVAGTEYRRSVRLARGLAVAGLSPAPGGVRLRLWGDPGGLGEASERVSAMLDLDREPATIEDALGADELIGALVRADPGRRVPGVLEPEEMAVRAVIGQQISLAGAATIAGRLAATLGERLAQPSGAVTHAFPEPAVLAEADPASLPMPRSRGRGVIALAAALASGDLDVRPGADPDAAEEALLALPGIGPWTMGVIRLRSLGDRDAFPAADLGLRRALERLGTDGRAPAALALAERWRPLRAYAAQHLWAVT